MADSKSGTKRQVSPALMKPVQPDEALAKVVGSTPLPRSEITKKMWQYIKANDLQEPTNKRLINADEILKPLFDGRDQVTMFEMTKLVNKHMS